MSVPSNLYAEKIFAEHPIALWAFDDQADYVSLISEAQRDVSLWTNSGGTATVDISITNQPFQSSVVNLIQANVPSGQYVDSIFIGDDLYNFNEMNQYYGTFCIGTYIYIDSAFAQTISVGYEYTDTSSAQIIQKFKDFEISLIDEWVFISATFDILNEDATIRPIIKIRSASGGGSVSDYQYYTNGITVGQWSEEFCSLSLGVEQIELPNSIAISNDYAIASSAYGLSNNLGYYLTANNALVAKNTSIPMVFGASGITRLIPNNNKPSLIVPGKGFLNKVGQYNDYTVEFWIRINSDAQTPKRIFGPISSSDGLYVESGFITLVIGNKFVSHFVGEWFRPMLIDIRIIRNFASVLINGEEVMSMTVDTESLSLPEEYSVDNKNQDWLGFYAYDDVSPIEIDCVAIYPYQVSVTLAKRRYVYGQGVISPEGINAAYSGTTAFIDYPFADYTANYSYPNFASWQQGSVDNLVAGDLALSTPTYNLPEIYLNNKTLQDLYNDNKEIQIADSEKFITFRPNSDWNSEICYFNFPQINVLNSPVAAIYGIFSSDDLDSEEILFKIYNSLTEDYFSIIKNADEIKYSLFYNGTEQILKETTSIIEDEKFFVGINIQDLSNYFGSNISTFFGNQSSTKMYIGGDNSGSYQFTGKIYAVGIATEYNVNKISQYFDSDGIAIFDDTNVTGSFQPENANAVLEHTASYTLIPLEAYDTYFLDIGVSGYWEDYMPLSYFGQFVQNSEGVDYYDLDFLQFNIGYPSPSSLKELETISSWTYSELKQEYNHPTVKNYSQLDNALLTSWQNYTDLQQKSIKYYEYDVSGASIKSHITFQYIEDGSNLLQSNFTQDEPLSDSGVIDLEDYTNWRNTKFNVVDNTIIYPKKTIDFNDLAIVYHLDFEVRGILTKPLSLRKLDISSQALNSNSFNPVGTKFGINLFPYTKSGIYFDYKAKNPFSIYKGTTPYLYLNRTSGIEVRGNFDQDISRGISLPINAGLAPEFSVSAVQMWLRYDKNLFPGSPQEIFEIDYLQDTIKFYFVADAENGNRARVYAKSQSTGQDFNGITYYWNGSIVREPVITAKEWGVLGLTFSDSLLFNAYLGSLNMIGPMVFNNIAYYQANNLQTIQSTRQRPWTDIKIDYSTNPDTEYAWSDWWGPNPGDGTYSWLGVLVTGTSELYGVNPSDVYKTYLGTNKIIFDDNEGLSLSDDKMLIYSDLFWQTSDIIAL